MCSCILLSQSTSPSCSVLPSLTGSTFPRSQAERGVFIPPILTSACKTSALLLSYGLSPPLIKIAPNWQISSFNQLIHQLSQLQFTTLILSTIDWLAWYSNTIAGIPSKSLHWAWFKAGWKVCLDTVSWIDRYHAQWQSTDFSWRKFQVQALTERISDSAWWVKVFLCLKLFIAASRKNRYVYEGQTGCNGVLRSDQ